MTKAKRPFESARRSLGGSPIQRPALRGPKGDSGTGPPGIRGPTGATGPISDPLYYGPTGATGPMGPAGSTDYDLAKFIATIL